LAENKKGYAVRVIESKDYGILNVCDEEVLGAKLEEKGLQIDISREFFEGEKVNDRRLLELLRRSQIINLTGNRCVSLAVDKGFAHKDAIRKIKSVSFLMIFKFNMCG
jgi:hypothetical protein